jgi:DNA-binding beta-propeller fold protein YncE
MKRHLWILPAILLLGLIRSVVAGQAPHLAESPDIVISSHDRIYTGDQTSNTVSVYDPSSNRLLGVLRLGDVTPQNLSPLYRGQLLVHGLGFSFDHKTPAIVSIGSNSVTFLDTATNDIKHIIYVGRSPHEPFFTPDGSELWVTVRGEDYVSVIDSTPSRDFQPLTRFTTNPAGAAIVNTLGPLRRLVVGPPGQNDRRYLVIVPFQEGGEPKPVQIQLE